MNVGNMKIIIFLIIITLISCNEIDIVSEIKYGNYKSIKSYLNKDIVKKYKNKYLLHIASEHYCGRNFDTITADGRIIGKRNYEYYKQYNNDSKLLKEKDFDNCNSIDNNNYYFNNYVKIIDDLLKFGIDINQKNEQGLTPIYQSLINLQIDIAYYLFKKGASLKIPKKNYISFVLGVLLKSGNKELLLKFIDENNVDISDGNKYDLKHTLLGYICDDYDLFIELIKRGANIFERDFSRYSVYYNIFNCVERNDGLEGVFDVNLNKNEINTKNHNKIIKYLEEKLDIKSE